MICLIPINRDPNLTKSWSISMDTTFAKKKELPGMKSYSVFFHHLSNYFIITERVVADVMVAVPTSMIAHGKMKMRIHDLEVEAVSPLEVAHQNAALDLNAIPIPGHARNAKKCLKKMTSLHYRRANRNLKSRVRSLQNNLPNPTGEKVNEELE